MLDTIGSFLESFASLFPRLFIVRKTEEGIKFKKGEIVIKLGPGLHIYWPLVSEIEVVPVVRQTLNLNSQTLMTQDGITVIASGVVVYTIKNITTYLVENYDAEESIAEVASGSVRDVIVNRTLKDIQENSRNTTDRALTKAASEVLDVFGIEVEYLRLTDFAKARIINIVGAQPLIPKSNE